MCDIQSFVHKLYSNQLCKSKGLSFIETLTNKNVVFIISILKKQKQKNNFNLGYFWMATTEYVAQASTKQNKGRTTLSFTFFP